MNKLLAYGSHVPESGEPMLIENEWEYTPTVDDAFQVPITYSDGLFDQYWPDAEVGYGPSEVD